MLFLNAPSRFWRGSNHCCRLHARSSTGVPASPHAGSVTVAATSAPLAVTITNNETTRLVFASPLATFSGPAASDFAANHGDLPIVYAGDFNSSPGDKHAIDGPAIAMREVHAADAFDVARRLSRTKYNSANGYLRVPPATATHIDQLYGSPGVTFSSLGQLLQLSSGKFVGTIPSDHNPIVVDAVLPY